VAQRLLREIESESKKDPKGGSHSVAEDLLSKAEKAEADSNRDEGEPSVADQILSQMNEEGP